MLRENTSREWSSPGWSGIVLRRGVAYAGLFSRGLRGLFYAEGAAYAVYFGRGYLSNLKSGSMVGRLVVLATFQPVRYIHCAMRVIFSVSIREGSSRGVW